MRHLCGKIIASILGAIFIFFACVDCSTGALSTETVNPEVDNTIVEEQMSIEDIRLIALVTIAEAESECELGKRLVIDTILNRKDSPHFPNTIYEVVYQPSQFTSMWNGRVDRCEVTEDVCRLVREELYLRTNSDCVFFTAGDYSTYGVPMFRVENHYFSSYEWEV